MPITVVLAATAKLQSFLATPFKRCILKFFSKNGVIVLKKIA